MMPDEKNIAVVSPNCLMSLGLKSIFNDFFQVTNIKLICSADEFFEDDANLVFDLVFINSEFYVIYNQQFTPIRNRLVVLTQNEPIAQQQGFGLATLDTRQSVSEIVQSLERIFASRIRTSSADTQESLSVREIEVLKLVALGMLNKQIADQLCISTHTVVSHRKNLTRKLGINTVSGLTVYAIINGLINADDLQVTNFV